MVDFTHMIIFQRVCGPCLNVCCCPCLNVCQVMSGIKPIKGKLSLLFNREDVKITDDMPEMETTDLPVSLRIFIQYVFLCHCKQLTFVMFASCFVTGIIPCTRNCLCRCQSLLFQDSLLHHLGINTTDGDTWPLAVYPRTLAVFAEVILLRQQQERSAKQLVSHTESVIIRIWTRFLNTLTNNIMTSHGKTDPNEGSCTHCFYVLTV